MSEEEFDTLKEESSPLSAEELYRISEVIAGQRLFDDSIIR